MPKLRTAVVTPFSLPGLRKVSIEALTIHVTLPLSWEAVLFVSFENREKPVFGVLHPGGDPALAEAAAQRLETIWQSELFQKGSYTREGIGDILKEAFNIEDITFRTFRHQDDRLLEHGGSTPPSSPPTVPPSTVFEVRHSDDSGELYTIGCFSNRTAALDLISRFRIREPKIEALRSVPVFPSFEDWLNSPQSSPPVGTNPALDYLLRRYQAISKLSPEDRKILGIDDDDTKPRT